MNRRHVLSSLAVTPIGLSGCTGLLDDSVDCVPGDDETPLADALDLVNESGNRAPRLSVRGTIVRFHDRGAIVRDPTGVARLSTGLQYELDRDRLDVGDCLSADVSLDKRASWSAQMPILHLRLDNLSRAGTTADADVENFADVTVPDASFDVDLDSSRTSTTTTVTLTHDGGEPVPASDLLVCYGPERPDVRRPTLDDTTRHTWADLDDRDDVTDGDTVTLDIDADSNGSLVWTSGVGWNEKLRGWAT